MPRSRRAISACLEAKGQRSSPAIFRTIQHWLHNIGRSRPERTAGIRRSLGRDDTRRLQRLPGTGPGGHATVDIPPVVCSICLWTGRKRSPADNDAALRQRLDLLNLAV